MAPCLSQNFLSRVLRIVTLLAPGFLDESRDVEDDHIENGDEAVATKEYAGSYDHADHERNSKDPIWMGGYVVVFKIDVAGGQVSYYDEY